MKRGFGSGAKKHAENSIKRLRSWAGKPAGPTILSAGPDPTLEFIGDTAKRQEYRKKALSDLVYVLKEMDKALSSAELYAATQYSIELQKLFDEEESGTLTAKEVETLAKEIRTLAVVTYNPMPRNHLYAAEQQLQVILQKGVLKEKENQTAEVKKLVEAEILAAKNEVAKGIQDLQTLNKGD